MSASQSSDRSERPASEMTLAEIGACEGTGRRWLTGMGRPICPVCHAGPAWLKVRKPQRRRPGWAGQVPAHPSMVVWSGRADPEAWRAAHPEYRLTARQVAALNQVRRAGASAMSAHTSIDRNTVHANSARAVVRAGLAEQFTGPDGGRWIRIPPVTATGPSRAVPVPLPPERGTS